MQATINREGFDVVIHSTLLDYLNEAGSYTTLVVKGESMSPLLHHADKIIIQQKKHYYPGDVVAYYCVHLKSYVVHRLLGKLEINNKSRYLIKGDNRACPDALVDESMVVGCATEFTVSNWLKFNCRILFIYYLISIVINKVINGIR